LYQLQFKIKTMGLNEGKCDEILHGVISRGFLKDSAVPVHLTAREVEIVKLAMKEKCSKEMADVLCISTRTVEKHRKHIMEKTECKNFIGVVLFALKYKLIELDGV
jgi:DNA-binding CsgD family transcriptional regulator